MSHSLRGTITVRVGVLLTLAFILLAGGACYLSEILAGQMEGHDAAVDAIRHFRDFSILWLAATLCVGIGLTWLLAGSYARELRSLITFIHHLPSLEGKSRKMIVRTDDEIGALASELNRLIASLDTSTASVRETSAFNEAVVDSIDDLLIVVNRDLRIIAGNGKFPEGKRSRSQFLGMSCAQAMGEGECTTCPSTAVFASGKTQRVEMVAGLSGRSYDVHAFPVFDDGGAVLYVIEIFMDVTERKELLAAVERTSRLSRLILDSVGEGICGLDKSGQLIFANSTAQRMLRPDGTRLSGDYCLIFCQQPQRCAHDQEQCRIHASEADWTVERVENVVLRRNDGTSFPADLVSTPIIEEGEVTGTVVVFGDISQQQQAAEELRLAKERAEAANRAKSEYLSQMSHEIRSPLNAIIGLTQLAQQAAPSPPFAEYFQKIGSSSRVLSGIVNAVLDFSKIEAGKLELEEVPFQLDGVLSLVADIASVQAERKGLRVTFSRSPEVPGLLTGDPLRLSQVLLNLVDNAVKFTLAGSVTVTVTVDHFTPGRVSLRFTVADTGIGMTPEDLPRIFAPFFQVKGGGGGESRGTGLGLAISRRLVELMQGEMVVESAPGKGTTFAFTGDFTVGGDIRSPVKTLSDLTGRKILVVDDNPINRKVLQVLLEKAGAHSITAGDGFAALNALSAHRVDLVLMDIQMPGMDGLQTTTAIRSEAALRHLPVIAVTAEATSADRERCLSAGMSGYITKPIDPAELLDLLGQYFAAGTLPASLPGESVAPRDTERPLDWTAGMERVGGSEATYRRLLAKFAQTHADKPTLAAEAIRRGDQEEARRIAHLLKGVAGNLSLIRLERGAAALERELKQQDTSGAAALAGELVASLEEVLTELNSLGII